jgi:transposase
VEAGPDPEKDGVARWRCVDLKRVVGARFAVDLSEVSLGRVLRKLGFSHISARPLHPKQDPEAIATFKKKLSGPRVGDREPTCIGNLDRGVVPG